MEGNKISRFVGEMKTLPNYIKREVEMTTFRSRSVVVGESRGIIGYEKKSLLDVTSDC